MDAGAILERAARLADDLLFPAATAVDAADRVPAGHLDALAGAGLYGLCGPVEAGGLGASAETTRAVTEVLAGGCLSTTFLWAQHHGLVRAVAGDAPAALRDEWLGPLCAGERRAGVALGGLLPGTPRLRAEPAGAGGWSLTGSSPWVTGWGLVDVLLVAARGPGDTLVWLILDAGDQPGLSVDRQRLVAADAAVTVRLDLAGVPVPAARVVKVEPYLDAPDAPVIPLRSNGSLALGVAGRCCRLLGPGPLDADLTRCREALDRAGAPDLPAARADASVLALRVAAALVVSDGGPAITRGHHGERLAREALFLLVFGTRTAIRRALLARLTEGSGPALEQLARP